MKASGFPRTEAPLHLSSHNLSPPPPPSTNWDALRRGCSHLGPEALESDRVLTRAISSRPPATEGQGLEWGVKNLAEPHQSFLTLAGHRKEG